MPPDTSQQNNEIIRRIEVLEEKILNNGFQIKYPMDEEAIDILNHYFLRVIDIQSWVGGVAGRNFVQYVAQQLEIPNVGNQDQFTGFGINKFTLNQLDLFQVGAIDITSDLLTLLDDIKGIDSGTEVSFLTEDTAPGGISGTGLVNYKINNLKKQTFNLTDTDDVAIDITDTGSGRLFMQIN